MEDDILASLLDPKQLQRAEGRATSAALLNLGLGLLQGSQGQRGRPSTLSVLGQVGPQAVQAYQGSFDQTLRDIMLKQQMGDAQAKRAQQAAVQKALQLPTPQAQIQELRRLGEFETIGGLAASEKALRQSGLMRQPGDMALENPFSIYAQSEIPGVAKLGQQYQKSYEAGNIDDEKATARLGELARMEESALTRTESAKERESARAAAAADRADARATAAADRATARETTAAFRAEGAAEREAKRLEGTESQKLSAGFSNRMIFSNSIVDQLEQSGTGLPTVFTSFAGGVPILGGFAQRKAMTEDQQKYKQAADNWIRANLRKESGAAIPEEEMAQEYQTYFPMPGDDLGTIAQKADSRKITTQAMITNAGPAFREPTTIARPRPDQGTPPTSPRTQLPQADQDLINRYLRR